MRQYYFIKKNLKNNVNLNKVLLATYTIDLIRFNLNVSPLKIENESILRFSLLGKSFKLETYRQHLSVREYFYIYKGLMSNTKNFSLSIKLQKIGISLNSWFFLIKSIRAQKNKNYNKIFFNSAYQKELLNFYRCLQKLEILKYRIKKKTNTTGRLVKEFYNIENGSLDEYWMNIKKKIEKKTYSNFYMVCLRFIASPALYLYILSLKSNVKKISKTLRRFNRSKNYLKYLSSRAAVRTINFGPNSKKSYSRDLQTIKKLSLIGNGYYYEFPKISNTDSKTYNPFYLDSPSNRVQMLQSLKSDCMTYDSGYGLKFNFAAIFKKPINFSVKNKYIIAVQQSKIVSKNLSKLSIFKKTTSLRNNRFKVNYNKYRIMSALVDSRANNLSIKRIFCDKNKSFIFRYNKYINNTLNLTSEKKKLFAYSLILNNRIVSDFRKQGKRYNIGFLDRKTKKRKKVLNKKKKKIFKTWKTFLAITHFRNLKKRPFWLMRKFNKKKKHKPLKYLVFRQLLLTFGVPKLHFIKYKTRYRLPSKRYLRLKSYHEKKHKYPMKTVEFDIFCLFNTNKKKRYILRNIAKKNLKIKKLAPKNWLNSKIAYLRYWNLRKLNGTFPLYFKDTQEYLRIKKPRRYYRLFRKALKRNSKKNKFLIQTISRNLDYSKFSITNNKRFYFNLEKNKKCKNFIKNKKLIRNIKISHIKTKLFSKGFFTKMKKNSKMKKKTTKGAKVLRNLNTVYALYRKYCLFSNENRYKKIFNFALSSDVFNSLYSKYLKMIRLSRLKYFNYIKNYKNTKNYSEITRNYRNRFANLPYIVRAERKNQVLRVAKNLFFKKNKQFIRTRWLRITTIHPTFGFFKKKKIYKKRINFLKKIPKGVEADYANNVMGKYWGPKWVKFKNIMLRKTINLLRSKSIAHYVFWKKTIKFFYSDRFNKQFRGLRISKPKFLPKDLYKSVMSRIFNLRKILKSEIFSAKGEIKKLNLRFLYKKQLRFGSYMKTKYKYRIPNYRFALRRFLQNGKRRMPQYWIRVKKKKYPLKNQKKEWTTSIGFWETNERYYREKLTFFEGSLAYKTGVHYHSTTKAVERFNVYREMSLMFKFNKGKTFTCLAIIDYLQNQKNKLFRTKKNNSFLLKNKLYGLVTLGKNKKQWINSNTSLFLFKKTLKFLYKKNKKNSSIGLLQSLSKTNIRMSNLSIILGKFLSKLEPISGLKTIKINKNLSSKKNNYKTLLYKTLSTNFIYFYKNSSFFLVDSLATNLIKSYGTLFENADFYFLRNGYTLLNKKISLALGTVLFSKTAIHNTFSTSLLPQNKVFLSYKNSTLNLPLHLKLQTDLRLKKVSTLKNKTALISENYIFSEKFEYRKFFRILTLSGLGFSRAGILSKVW